MTRNAPPPPSPARALEAGPTAATLVHCVSERTPHAHAASYRAPETLRALAPLRLDLRAGGQLVSLVSLAALVLLCLVGRLDGFLCAVAIVSIAHFSTRARLQTRLRLSTP